MTLIDSEKLIAWVEMNAVGSSDSRMIYVSDLLQGLGGHTQVEHSGDSYSWNVDTDSDLSLAAVGLWHKLRSIGGSQVHKTDLLTLEVSPTAWGPGDDVVLQDLEVPMNQLLADGYIQEDEADDTILRLFYER